jgi:2-(1,2-epoxy-1,2-dihydrophenyl)acetyl-CoA isomerase
MDANRVNKGAVLTEVCNGILKITLNRPKALNALNLEMIVLLSDIIVDADLNKSIHVIIIEGSNENFMAGGDLYWLKSYIDNRENISVDDLDLIVGKAQNLARIIYDIKKPVITSVEGVVAGFGLAIVAASDFTIATKDSSFSTAYSRVGLTPDGGLSYILPRIIGPKKAKELLMLASSFSADKALELGLINQIVIGEDLVTSVAALANRLQSGASNTISAIKMLVNTSYGRSLSGQLDVEKNSFIQSLDEENALLGINAFLERRTPKFTDE